MSGKAVRETLGFLGLIASMIFVGIEHRDRPAHVVVLDPADLEEVP